MFPIGIIDQQSLVAKHQLDGAQLCRDQFLESQCRRRLTPGKLGHKGHAGVLHAPADAPGFVRFQIQRRRTINRFARIASGQDRQRAKPLGG